jgi:nucleoside-diphosphate-sugar epimerase
VAVTGGSGYLGGRIVSRLLGDSGRVITLGRRPSGIGDVEHRPFRLGDPVAVSELADVDVLVHCAWDLQLRTWDDIYGVNVLGTQALFDAAVKAGVGRLVHISTVSAAGAPRSMYGRAKLLTEEMVESHGGIAIRPGLLYGPGAGGMVGILSKLVRALPLVPVLVGDDRPLYLAHQDDAVELIALVAGGAEGAVRKPLVAAATDPHSLREILAAIASAQGKRRLLFRVPWRLIYLALRSLEVARLYPPMRADSALSIGTLDPNPFDSGAAPGTLAFRHFEPSALREEVREAR